MPLPAPPRPTRPPPPAFGAPVRSNATRLRIAAGVLAGVCALAAVLWFTWPSATPVSASVPLSLALPEDGTSAGPVARVPEPEPVLRHADFGAVSPTVAARTMADWVVARADNGDRPFMVLDKVDARVYLFAPDGTLRGRSPVLLGKAVGDDSAPGIGLRPLNQIREDEKTTPAGRFLTAPGRNLNGEAVVWVDYADAISMHRVRKVAESEHRLARLASATPDDNRISYGCINVPADFFDAQIAPTLGRQAGVAYVIPEVKTMAQVFEGGAARLALVGPGVRASVAVDR